MKLLWWRRPDLILSPAGVKTWEIRSTSPRGREWMHTELGDGAHVVLGHDQSVEMMFRAIRDGLVVCSDPVKPPTGGVVK